MIYEKQTWNTGDIITAEKLNHIETGIVNASSGGSNQADWNQNDSTQPDYIKNRPFYSSLGLITLLDEPELESGYSENLLSKIISSPIEITFDGVNYTFDRFNYNESDNSYYVGAPWSDELDNYDWSEYSFNVLFDYGEGEHSDTKFTVIDIVVICADVETTHSVTIKCNEETVHKLDSKYIPQSKSATLFLYYNDLILYLDAECSKVATIDDIQNIVMIGYLWDGGNDVYYVKYSDTIQFHNNSTQAQVHIVGDSAGAVWIFDSNGNSYSAD